MRTMNLSTADLRNYWNFQRMASSAIGQCRIFTPYFECHVLAAILKMADILKILKTQNCSSNGDLSLCQILCLYYNPFRSYMMSRIYSRHWKISSGRHFQNGRQNSTLSDFNDISYVGRLWCPEFILDIDKFLEIAIFKMAAEIQHCPILSKFDMWVDNDVLNWFLYEMSLKSDNVEFVW
jgi:hypothetical protein